MSAMGWVAEWQVLEANHQQPSRKLIVSLAMPSSYDQVSRMKRRDVIFTASLMLLCACHQKETASHVSPDGSFVAKFFDDRDGGAAVSAYERIEIASTSSGDQIRVFSGENMGGRATQKVPFGDLNISWRDRRTLLIEYCDGHVTEHVPSAKIGGETISVILSQEQRGAWPDNIPLDRRIGPQPCR